MYNSWIPCFDFALLPEEMEPPSPPHTTIPLLLSLTSPSPLNPDTLPSLVSELLSLSLSLPELTTQEVTTDSINSSYINPAIIAPPARLSASSLSPLPPFPVCKQLYSSVFCLSLS